MPFCEVCKNDVPAAELIEDPVYRQLHCKDCKIIPLPVEVLETKTLLGREFNYDFSYSKKNGFKAEASLGKAKLTLHVPQEELVKTFG